MIRILSLIIGVIVAFIILVIFYYVALAALLIYFPIIIILKKNVSITNNTDPVHGRPAGLPGERLESD